MTRIFDATGSARPTGWSVSRTVRNRNGLQTALDVATYTGSNGQLKRAGVNRERIDCKPVTGEVIGLLVEPQGINRSDGGYDPNGSGIGQGGNPDPFGTNCATKNNSGDTNYQFFDYVAALTQFVVYVKPTLGVGQVIGFGCDRTGHLGKYNADTGAWTYGGNARGGTATPAANGFVRLAFLCDQPAGNSSIYIQSTAGASPFFWVGLSANNPPRFSLILAANATSPVTVGPDVVALKLGSDVTALTLTFSDGTTQAITGLTPGSTYTLPALNGMWLRYIDDDGALGDGLVKPPTGRLGTAFDIKARPLYYFDPSSSKNYTLDGNGRVQIERDVAGGSLTAQCPDSDITHRPTLVAGAIGGLDAIGLNGGNGWSRTPLALAGTAIHVFAVVKPVNAQGYSRFMSFSPRDGQNDWQSQQSFLVQQNNGNGQLSLTHAGNGSAAVPFTNGKPMLLEVVYDGSSLALYRSGILVGQFSKTNGLDIIASTFGLNAQGADAFSGQQGARMVYGVALSAADRAWVRGCLSWQWDGGVAGDLVDALPGDDPWKTYPPRVAEAVVQAARRRRPFILQAR